MIGAVLSGIALIVAGVIGLIPATLGYIGFTATGVVAGSIAAAIQSVIYGGATAGLFSICQSIGALWTVGPGIAMAGFSMIGAGFTLLWHTLLG